MLAACLALPSITGAATTPSYSLKWSKSVSLLNPNFGGGFDAASCAPTTSATAGLFCVAADVRGDVFGTIHPAQAASQWARVNIDPKTAITGVSCPSAALCVAVDAAGRVLHSANVGTKMVWSKPLRINSVQLATGGFAGFSAIDCPSTTFCIAVDNGATDQIAYTTDPTGPASAWTLTTVGTGVLLDAVSCASTTMCVVGGSNIYFSTQPTGGASAWKATAALSSSNSVVSALTCNTVKLCLGVGYGDSGVGLSVGSSTPTTTTWSQGLIGSDPPAPSAGLIDSVACPQRNLCVAVDGASNAYTSVTPVRGAWTIARPLKPNSQSTISQVTCNSTICLEVDSRGTVTYGAVHSGSSTSTSTTTTPTSTKTTTTKTTSTTSTKTTATSTKTGTATTGATN